MPLPPASKKPYYIFYSYADEDEALLKKLDKHLSTLVRQGEIIGWNRRNISAGKEWEDELTKHMNRAKIILLLISQHFIASDYVYSLEMKYAMQRREHRKAMIIPIILRPCEWDGHPFSNYEVLPSDEKPVTKWSNQDDAFLDIVQGIRRAVQNLRAFELNPNQHTLPSIKPPQTSCQQQKITKPTQARPRNTTITQDTRGRTKNSQKQAQTAEVGRIPISRTRKPLPKRSLVNTIITSYLSPNEFDIYFKGKDKDFFRSIVALGLSLDVIGLVFISQYWLQSQLLLPFIFLASLFAYLWGILNIKLYIALLLTALYAVIWLLFGFLYLHWPPIIIITLSLAFIIIRLLIFPSHQRRRR